MGRCADSPSLGCVTAVVRMGRGLSRLGGDASLLSNLLLDAPESLVEVHLTGCASKVWLDLSGAPG